MASNFPLYDLFCEKDEPGQFLFAFNEQVDLAVAYKLDAEQILKEIRKIAVNLNDQYGTRTAKNQVALTALEPFIGKLCKLDHPYGVDYREPDPRQHIRRKKAGTALEIFPTTVLISSGNEPPRTPPHNEDLAIFADILGMFIAIATNPVPHSATRENFIFPLLAVYSKWIMTLSNTNRVQPPAMAQATWYESEKIISDIFLGASTGGIPTDTKSREWTKKIWQWRFNTIAVGNARFAQDNWIWSESISHTNQETPDPNGLQRRATKGGTCFGNCAETYPFISTLKIIDGAEKAMNYYGLAMMPKKTKSVEALSARKLALYPNLHNPCANCRYLIDIWQGVRANFFLHFVDADGEPTGPFQLPNEPIPKA